MKRILVITVMSVCLLFLASSLYAASSIEITHTLTSYLLSDDGITLDFALIVKNTGQYPIHEITLKNIPTDYTPISDLILQLGDLLELGGSASVAFQIHSSLSFTEIEAGTIPLFWEVTLRDIDSTIVTFTAESRVEGGEL